MNGGVSRRDLALAAGALAAGLPQAASAAALADSPNGIVLDPGDHPVNANITIKTDILLLPGARIVVAPGRTAFASRFGWPHEGSAVRVSAEEERSGSLVHDEEGTRGRRRPALMGPCSTGR